jgi:transposase
MNISFSHQQLRFSGDGGHLLVPKSDLITHRLAMLIAGQCEGQGATYAANQFGFSRQRYYQLLDLFKEQGALGLAPGTPGPKSDYRRTEQLVRLIIRHRFLDPEVSAEVIAQKLRQDGNTISQRSVERTIAEYGLQKKTLRS